MSEMAMWRTRLGQGEDPDEIQREFIRAMIKNRREPDVRRVWTDATVDAVKAEQ
jgi:hypothetical protein